MNAEESKKEIEDTYRSDKPTHNGYGQPRGPISSIPENAPTVAIGFCPMCGENCRKSCYNRGMFSCSNCFFVWYDDRVGQQSRSFDDYFSKE
jgi:hypothetical protein